MLAEEPDRGGVRRFLGRGGRCRIGIVPTDWIGFVFIEPARNRILPTNQRLTADSLWSSK